MAKSGSEETQVVRRNWTPPKVALVGAIFAVLLLICSGIALAANGEAPDDSGQSADLSAPPPAEPPVELKAARTANSQTFLLPDGSREARISETPINFRDEGQWQPIVEGFKPKGLAFEDREHPFNLVLPAHIGNAPVRFSTSNYSISFELANHESTPADLEAGNTVSYEVANTDTSFEYRTLPNGLKETIELASPTSPSTVRYNLSASPGLNPELERDGSIVFRDADGKSLAALPAPSVSDASSVVPQLGHASYVLSPRGEGSWELAVEVDRDWLDAPSRDWPVQIDPTVYETGATAVCGLIREAPNNSYCFEPSIFRAWTYAENQSPVRSLLGFNLSAIPTDAAVKEASVSLWGELWGTTTGVELRRVTRPWNGNASWNKASCSGSVCESWSSPGGDFNSEGSEILTSERGTQTGWWNFSKGLAPVFQGWLAGNPQAGLIVKQKDEGVCPLGNYFCGLSFASYTGEASKRPIIRVVYWPQAPLSSKLVSPTEGTVTARRLKLKSKWTSAGVTGVSYEFREGKTGPFATIPVELVRRANGAAISKWPVPTSGMESEPLYFDAAHATSTLRKKGGPIQVRAVFEGPAEVEGYSAPVEATINRFTGGPKDASAQVGPGSLNLLTGNLSVTRTDVQIPGFTSTLAFSRTHNSRGLALKGTPEEVEENKGVLGAGWKPGVPVEEAGGSDWRNLKIVEEKGNYEEEIGEEEVVVREYSFSYAVLTSLEGAELAFEKQPNGTYAAPPEVAGVSLTTEGGKFLLADPGGGLTTFENIGGGSEYVPTAISEPGGSGNSTRVEYKLKEGKKRINMVVAPTPAGIGCVSETEATTNVGCHALTFTYVAASTWGAPASYGDRLQKVTSYAPGNSSPQVVANYKYDSSGRLIEEWDSRLSAPVVEQYTYPSGGQLATITPPGQEPWKMEYGTIDEEEANGRLMAVKRASLLASPTEAQTTIAYGVPVSGSGAPYDLSGSQLAQWAQLDIPVDATAVFPPDQVPTSNPPSSYSAATVYYMDAEGQNVNTATPKGGGTSAPSISTSEVDEFGHVGRELTAANRLRALAEPEAKRAERAKELDTHRLYSSDGTQMEEEWGPMHKVRLESGTVTQARFHKVVQYDKNWPGTGVKPHLPTRETSGALVGGEVLDQRVSETEYNWNLRQPKYTLVDPGTGHLNIKTVTSYDETTGLPIESRQPKDAEAAGAGTTKTIYYKATGSGECENAPKYANLPCKVLPAAQASGSGRPELLVKKFTAYNVLEQPTEVVESPGGGASNVRKTLVTYDGIGRTLSVKREGGGVALPKSEVEYSKTTGLPTAQRLVCETSCTGFDTQTTTSTYDALGRIKGYEDADGNKSTTTYDVDGRPVTTSDAKGSQTLTYDPTSGLPTKLEDSAAGTFTAAYDADGNVIERGFPNGLTAKTTYNEADEATQLAYTKVASCGESCTWFEEGLERSVYGQILSTSGTLVSQQYAYDKDGRLKQAQETPKGGSCTTRLYSYDADSNRTELTTREPGVGGACATTGGTLQKYEYDSADRLFGTGLTYDNFGRITSLPAADAGGKALTTEYFSTDMVAKQTQNGVTNEFQLDASLRPRQRLQGGGLEGTEIFHYDDGDDAPAWTERGTTWTRSIPGIGGELAAIQDSSSGTTFQVTNLHGNVVATASSSPTATKLLATFRSDEFGNPVSGSAGRFGWLGGKQRRTELSSGVIQMGARSYVPALGRFLTPDSIPGGSANPYDYANQDPVNEFDLEGTCSTKKKCTAARREAKAKVRKAVSHIRGAMQEAREKRASAGASSVHIGPETVTFPWEHAAEKVLGKVESSVSGIFNTSCGDAAEGLAYAGGSAAGAGVLLQGGGPVSSVVGGMLINLGARAGIFAGILYGGSKLGIC